MVARETVSGEPVPLIELAGIRKHYGGRDGEPSVEVLHGVDLTIHAGEFIALVGASGSGKSTLMHILGCLDRPSSGSYRFAGQDISYFTADELAWLRREAFGFVFQGYHLIRTLDASHNVQVPAVYAGVPLEERQARAQALLEQLGLGGRSGHRPGQLSGGQQQRVSIARALVNGGHVILADEPTGALDSKSGAEVMALLKDLAGAGHTIVLVTHDPQVAAQARRVVRISDGCIVEDRGTSAPQSAPSLDTLNFMAHMTRGAALSASWMADVREALSSAWSTLWASRFRTVLTLLGIVIGVASVIVLMAVGQGNSEKVLERFALWGTHRLYVYANGQSARTIVGRLSEADARLVQGVPNVRFAMPFQIGQAMLRAGGADYSTKIWAVSADAPSVLSWKNSKGVFFSHDDDRQLAPVVVLGKTARERLFGAEDFLGRYVLVNNVPFQVIGEMEEKGTISGNADHDDVALLPFHTASRRVLGTTALTSISVLVDRLDRIDQTVADITEVLKGARRMEDFFVVNSAAEVRAHNETLRQQTLLVALIASISLVVGGIGIMNIMLMAVKERTREIGIRMATGARQRDIQRQFLTEAVMVSLVGGVAGVVIGLLIGVALIWWDVPVIVSVRAILLAFGCAVATGLIFGFMPARQASKLDPVVALMGE
ncbi:MAG: ATP-binding cassette domain-containing protein [Acidovorax sp.]